MGCRPYHQVVLSTVSTASGAANDSAARAQDPLPTTHCKIYLVALKEGLARYQRIIIPVTCTRLYGINVKCCYQPKLVSMPRCSLKPLLHSKDNDSLYGIPRCHHLCLIICRHCRLSPVQIAPTTPAYDYELDHEARRYIDFLTRYKLHIILATRTRDSLG